MNKFWSGRSIRDEKNIKNQTSSHSVKSLRRHFYYSWKIPIPPTPLPKNIHWEFPIREGDRNILCLPHWIGASKDVWVNKMLESTKILCLHCSVLRVTPFSNFSGRRRHSLHSTKLGVSLGSVVKYTRVRKTDTRRIEVNVVS